MVAGRCEHGKQTIEGKFRLSDPTLTICFDGTFNETDMPDAQSNVLLLWRLLAEYKDAYYLEGVGTRQGERIGGGVRGCGVRDRIKDAYVWLQARFARLVPRPANVVA